MTRLGGALVLGLVVTVAALAFGSRPLGVVGVGLLFAAGAARIWRGAVRERVAVAQVPDPSPAVEGARVRLAVEARRGSRVPVAAATLRGSLGRLGDYECRLRGHGRTLTGIVDLGRLPRGLFRVAESLYGIRIRASEANIWHEDVRFFDIVDAAGGLVGQFYVDLYARETKRGGAWMDDAITRRRKGTLLQTPVAYLNCNFSRPVGGKPALFTHDEVLTLFHEFGHGLHHLLTRVDDLGVSGINGVEWDAVELPS